MSQFFQCPTGIELACYRAADWMSSGGPSHGVSVNEYDKLCHLYVLYCMCSLISYQTNFRGVFKKRQYL